MRRLFHEVRLVLCWWRVLEQSVNFKAAKPYTVKTMGLSKHGCCSTHNAHMTIEQWNAVVVAMSSFYAR